MTFTVPIVLGLPTALAFLGYGLACLFTKSMQREFERFGLGKFRTLIGVTQLLGAAALTAGPWFPLLGFLGSTGLAIEMAAGLGVRVRVGDTWQQALQASFFLLINVLLAWSYYCWL